MNDHPDSPAAAGLHLQQGLALVGPGRPSVVATVDAGAALVDVRRADGDPELLAAVPSGVRLCVDAPLVVPDEEGTRDVERLLAWLDIPTFPSSRRRLAVLHGGLRGEHLRTALAARAADVVEAVPDATIRQILLESGRVEAGSTDLAEYRRAWIDVRAPRYRPKGEGRAHPAGTIAAAAIVARVVDLGGWAPRADADDWGAIEDAAVLDAIVCAYTALRAQDPVRALRLGTPERGEVLLAADRAMRMRAAVNLARLRSEGVIAI